MFESPLLKKRLLWPLSIGSLGAFTAAWLVPAGGLFLNLGTTFLGILLTVGYVDLILKQHEKDRWAGPRSRISKRLENVAAVASSQFRIAFGFGPEVYGEAAFDSEHDASRRRELVRVAMDIVYPSVPDKVREMSTADCKSLCKQLAISWESADRMIELFGSRLEPTILAVLIDLQDCQRSVIDHFRTFPDVLGTPDNELQPNLRGESSVPLKRTLEKAVSKDIRAVLDLSAGLFNQLDVQSARTAA